MGRRAKSLGLLVVAVAAFLGPRAFAAPATVKVFEAQAREAPDDDARVVHTFPEDEELSVSEEAKDGWRRVRLPDGGTAFIRNDQIQLTAKTAPARVQPIRAAPVHRARTVYIKNLDHLADLVKEDGVVHPKAQALSRARTTSIATAVVGGLAGTILAVGGFTFLASENCNTGIPGYCETNYNMGAMYAGLGILALVPLIALVVSPTRSDLLDVINEWNARHGDRQFTLEHEPGMRN